MKRGEELPKQSVQLFPAVTDRQIKFCAMIDKIWAEEFLLMRILVVFGILIYVFFLGWILYSTVYDKVPALWLLIAIPNSLLLMVLVYVFLGLKKKTIASVTADLYANNAVVPGCIKSIRYADVKLVCIGDCIQEEIPVIKRGRSGEYALSPSECSAIFGKYINLCDDCFLPRLSLPNTPEVIQFIEKACAGIKIMSEDEYKAFFRSIAVSDEDENRAIEEYSGYIN